MACKSGVPGSVHDVTIARETIDDLTRLLQKTEAEAEDTDEEDTWAFMGDSGYQGLQHTVRAVLPQKRRPGHELTRAQKRFNTNLSSVRVVCENYYGRLKKKFRIMVDKYRGAREEYEHVFKACAALTNFDIQHHPLRSE